MKNFLIIFAFFFLFYADNSNAITSNSKFLKQSIIPEPVKVIPGEGSFDINENTLIVASDVDQLRSAAFLNGYISKYYGFKLKVVSKTPKAKSSKNGNLQFINLSVINIADSYAVYSPADLKKEGAYALTIKDGVANLSGANPQGLFYAVQTLIQLLPTIKPNPEPGSKSLSLPVQSVEVIDFPRFEYRGMHLDVVRHIFSVDYVKQYIDYLALHKMNYFHWHLTDDQGWRMESKKYPKLNEIGSWRAGTIIGMFPGTGLDSTRYGGFYTIEQMKDVINYAADRYITIVPEIDIPGHCMALIASFPQFSTTPNIHKEPAITWGMFNRENNVLAPSEEVFAFLKDVYNELMDVFPGQYIHVGGDECAKKWWKESPETQDFMKKHGLKDELELQSYFIKRVSEVVKGRGRTIVGWEEIMEGGLVEGSIVMNWRNHKSGLQAAQKGYKTILAPGKYSYMNNAQKRNEDSLGPKRYLPVDSVYLFEPVPEGFPETAAANIMGGQGCMWTEYFPNKERLEYTLFPRFSALAEVYWTQSKNKNWPKFQLKLIDQFNRYDLWGTNYSTEIFRSGDYSR